MGRRELEEESKERKRGERTEGRLGVQAVWRLHRHTCYPSAGEKGRVFFLGGAQEEREGDRSSETAQKLVCVCAWLLSLYCNGRQTYECLAGTTEGVLERLQRLEATHQCLADETSLAPRKTDSL